MRDGPLSFQRAWEGFLPANAVVMAKRRPADGATVSLRFGFEAPDLADPAARELLDKILSALELPPDRYAVVARAAVDFTAATLVRFVASEGESAGVWERAGDGNVLTTYSLRAMLGNPGLKKPVWAHLKDAVARSRKES